MINANELRIGNYVRCNISNDAGVYKVYRVGGWIRNWGTKKKDKSFVDEQLIMLNGGARDKEEYPESKISPIKLSPEILVKCGFKKMNGSKSVYHIFINDLEISINPDLSFAYIDSTWGQASIKNPIFKYLHQVQNLIFALTGKELEFNP